MKKSKNSKLSIFLIFTMVISTIFNGPFVAAAATGNENKNDTKDIERYTIYPNPHEIKYMEQDFDVTDQVNIVYDTKIDSYTKDRVEEILKNKDITFTESSEIVSDQTNYLVGIHDSGEYVDQYFKDEQLTDEATLEKLDANIVSIKDNVIAVLGKDIDSAFYGVTTVMHIFKQLKGHTIEELVINDYADVKGRGFIEGYYGEPWTTEDRADLMTFAGDFKMNSYLYAPKDDPKHNADWRVMYTDEELEDISELAEAGNASKARFVYTLHPFMNSVMSFGDDYEADLNVIKEKFTQLLDNGVRKFGILGDDAGVPGGDANNYVKLMEDLTDWLIEQEETYEGLVTDMIFTPNDYMGWGDSDQIQTLKKLPDSVSLVQTGGRVWGEVTDNFTSTFTENAGRGPYLWINWPVTDNSKQHLIMGGSEAFLQPGVDPANIEGIVLNPMQQAEPSKNSIFANADYSWNIWDLDQAEQNWSDSFAYMDHLNIDETPASNALRELSKHMINQDMDSRVVKLEESVELAPKLNEFKDALGNEKITEKAEALIKEFEIIRDAAQLYKDSPGNERMKDQMIYWLDSAVDTTNAAINLLKAEIAHEQDDKSAVWENYSQGQADFDASKDHPFSYIDHDEYAEVGVQHIVPFVKTLLSDVSTKAESIVNPDLNPFKVITNRTDNPTGDLKNLLDNNKDTEVVFKNPNKIETGTYIGVQYEKSITFNTVRFELGAIANKEDTFTASKAQYTTDGKEWIDIEGASYGHVDQVVLEDLELKAKGIRLIATEDHEGTWFGIKDIVINEPEKEDESTGDYKLMVPEHFEIHQGKEANLFDGDDSTFIWYNPSGEKKDTSVVGDYIGVDLQKVQDLGEVSFSVGRDNADKWTEYQLEYSTDNEEYTVHDTYTGKASGMDKIEADLTGIQARYVRLTNLKDVPVWIKFSEINIATTTGVTDFTYTNNDNYKNISASHALDNTSLYETTDITLKPGEYLGVKLERIKELAEVVASETSEELTLEASANEVEWTTPNEGTLTRYVRLTNNTDSDITFDLNKFSVISNEINGPSFVETDLGISDSYGDSDSRKTGTLLAPFDKNFGTKAIFTDYQKEGKSITYSVGEPRVFNKLRVYNDENDINYIRDAKVQLSMDNEEWTDVASVGDGEDNLTGGKADYADMIEDGYTHDSVNPGNYYFGNDDIGGIKAKYIRILFTADYDARFAHINEIMINDGEYVKTENNPTFEIDPIEEEGYGAELLVDGDLTTAFKPNMKGRSDGSLIYRLSEKTDVAAITIVQGSKAISNAKVSARVGADEWIDLGVLDSSLNTFYNATHDNIFEVKLTWGDVQPVIYEMNISNNKELIPDAPEVNKQELVDAIADAETMEEADYTANSWTAFANALIEAKAVNEAAEATQVEVNAAAEFLTETQGNLEEQQVVSKEALVTAIAEAEEKAESDYTADSWATFADALNDARRVEDDKNATQPEIDDATKALGLAAESLIDRSLENVIAKAKEKAEVDYTVESWNLFAEALENAESVLADEDATQEEVNAATDDLVEAQNSLVENVSVNTTDLADALAESKEIAEADYTVESWNLFAEALENAEVVLADEDATQEEVDVATASLVEAQNSLVENVSVNTTDLSDAIAEAEEKAEADYTVESWNLFAEALETAESVLSDEDATQEEVDAATASLVEAQNNLVEQPVVNKDLLVQAIAEAEEKAETDYTANSWKVFSEVFAEAKSINNKADATQAEIDASTIALIEAQVDLVDKKVTANKKELVNAITDAENKKEKTYTAKSWEVFNQALAYAKSVNASENATQEEVKVATEALLDTQEKLVKKSATVSKDKLTEVIKEAEKKVKKDYTSDSWKSLNEALKAGNEIHSNSDATQSEVDKSISGLKNAINNLEKVTEEDPSVDIDNDDKPIDSNGDTNQGDNNELPKTATNSYNFMLFGLTFILLGLLVAYMRKRKSMN